MRHEELGDLLLWRLAERKVPEHPLSEKGCVYHVHENGEKCAD